jgi:putative FmdB family regulatory protein
MPIYEYRCEDCHAQFEAFLRRYDEAVVCSQCQSTHLTKLVSSFSFGGGGEQAAAGHSHTAGKSCSSCSSSNCGSCS